MEELVSMANELDEEVMDMEESVEEMLEWWLEVPVETGGQTNWE